MMNAENHSHSKSEVTAAAMSVDSLLRQFAKDSGALVGIWTPDNKAAFTSEECWAWFGELYQRVEPPVAPHTKGMTMWELLPAWVAEERARVHAEVRATGRTVRLLEFAIGRLAVSTHRPLGEGGPTCDVGVFLAPITSRAEYLARRSDPSVRMATSSYGGPLGDLGVRQIEVLRLIGLGKSGTEIAKELHRSPRTVEFHRRIIRERLGPLSLVELGMLAVRSGLVYLMPEEIAEWWDRDLQGTGRYSLPAPEPDDAVA